MKTKFLLGALALPMFFAACTNEELMEAPVTANLQNRIPLGEVTLDFGGVDSRLALKDGNFNAFAWANGDDLGASLIDVRNTTAYDADQHINASVMYNLTSTPQTNYRYVYNNGSWTSPAAMVEGNYVFYMPYVENTNRVAPLAVLPVEQNLEQVVIDGETAYTTYNDVLANAKENGNIMAVAYKFLSAEGENNDGNKTISVSFKQLYATPLISIQNYARDAENDLTDLTIKKIVLSKSDNSDFTVKERLNFTAAAAGSTALDEAHGTGSVSIVKCLNTVLNPDDEEYLGGTWAVGDNTVAKATADLLATGYTEEDGSQASKTITINVEDPITVASEETFSFYAVIPGGNYRTSKLVVTLVTTDDEQVSVVMPAVYVNPGKRYAVSGYDEEGNVDAGAAAMLAVTTEQLVPAPILGVEIATQAELYSAIAKAVKVDPDGDGIEEKVALNFVPAEGVVLNNQVINMLNDKTAEIASITFHGDMTINGLTSTTTIPVKISGNATMNGTVEAVVTNNESGTESICITGAVAVAEGAKVKLSGALAKGLTNNGELTITAATTAADNVTNNGVLNMVLESTLTLTGKNLKNAEGASINAVGSASITATKVVNEGAINVVVDAENNINGSLTVTAEVENKGKVAAANTLTVTGKFTNKKDAEMNIDGGTTSVSAEFVNEGTVAIAEGATLTASYTGSINKNEINNAGTLAIDKNSGTINVTNSSKFGASTTTVSTACENVDGKVVWGNIYNPYGKTIAAATLNGTSQQYVWGSEEAYTGEVAWITGSTFNAVKYDGATITLKANGEVGSLIYVEFNGYSKLNVATFTAALPKNVQINKNELEIAGTGTVNFATGAVVTVAKDAVLGWNDNVNFGTATIMNYGKVYGNGNGTETSLTLENQTTGTGSIQ